jgi:molybdate transport system substrate-binding protein
MTRLTSSWRTGAAALLALALLVALSAASTARSSRTTAQMHIFAAASLTEIFPKLDGGQKYNFAGSDALAAQIRLGAPADIFAAASPDAPQALFRAGLVEQPVTFATNKLVLAVPTANPAGIASVYDLRRPGVKLLIGTPTVPIGSYTRQVLGNLGLIRTVMPNVVSQEKDAKAIASKLALGTADAGFMYLTDARAASGKVTVIGLPPRAQTPVRYQIAIVKSTQNRADATAFVKRLTSKAGRRLLLANGFGVPTPTPVR